MTYRVARKLIDVELLRTIRVRLDVAGLATDGGQTGRSLAKAPWAMQELAPRLMAAAIIEIGTPPVFKPELCSYRIQAPDAKGLRWHQDVTALGGVVGVVFWVPLINIESITPTLAISRTEYEPMEHERDDAGYAVLPADFAPDEFDIVSRLDLGDVVVMKPTTVHCSHVPTGAWFGRPSLDIRAVPS